MLGSQPFRFGLVNGVVNDEADAPLVFVQIGVEVVFELMKEVFDNA